MDILIAAQRAPGTMMPKQVFGVVILCALIAASCATKKAIITPEAAVPEETRTWNDKSASLLRQGSFPDALEAAEQALAIDPTYSFAWNNKSVALLGLGRPEEAIQAAEKAVEADPNNAVAWSNKGVAFRQMDRLPEALEAVERALALDPRNALIWYNKACYAALANAREEALSSLSQAFLLDGRLKTEAVREQELKSLWSDPEFRTLVD